jgi:hypothetical protein
MSDERPPERPVTQPGDPVQSRAMAMHQRNIRMEDALWKAAEDEARRQGMKASEFVRQAIMFRLGFLAAEHGTDTAEIEALLRRISERPTSA